MLHYSYLCRLARAVVLLLRGWEEFVLLQKLIQFVLYKHGEASEAFTVSLINTIYSMDGFKVVKLEDVCHFVDIVITCTGKHVIIV